MNDNVHEADGIKVLKGLERYSRKRPGVNVAVPAWADALNALNISPAMIAEVERVVTARQSGELFTWHPSVQPFLPPHMMREDFENDGTRYEKRPGMYQGRTPDERKASLNMLYGVRQAMRVRIEVARIREGLGEPGMSDAIAAGEAALERVRNLSLRWEAEAGDGT